MLFPEENFSNIQPPFVLQPPALQIILKDVLRGFLLKT
jgi:hypothetical protein